MKLGDSMKQRITNYLQEIDVLLQKNITISQEQIKNHLIQISFFQHERLIHLLVTIFVGLLAMLFLLFGLMLENIGLIIIFLCLLILFIPYLLHYYLLENGVQKMYHQYDLLIKNR